MYIYICVYADDSRSLSRKRQGCHGLFTVVLSQGSRGFRNCGLGDGRKHGSNSIRAEDFGRWTLCDLGLQ